MRFAWLSLGTLLFAACSSGGTTSPDAGTDAGVGGAGGAPPLCETSCKSLDSACTKGVCSAEHVCVAVPINLGDPCEDACSKGGTCDAAGECTGAQKVDCTILDGPCTVGACEPDKGCVPFAAHEGEACDDGLVCTEGDSCVAGLCTGAEDCPPSVDPCSVGVCDPEMKACLPMPAPNGTACDDADACTTGDACSGGTCGAGAPVTQCVGGDGCCPPACGAQDADCNPLPNPSYVATMTFQDALGPTTTSLTWDGTSFWSSSGATPDGVRLARYDAAGSVVATYSPGIDFRSLFTKGAPPVYAREAEQTVLRVQQTPGVFGQGVTLAGALDDQAAVVWDDVKKEHVANAYGTVTRWKSDGSLAGTVTLQGFGSAGTEADYPQGRGVAVAKGYYLTYDVGTLSLWDASGARVATTVLVAAGVSYDAHYSMSYAQKKVWVVDVAGGTWRGYDLGL